MDETSIRSHWVSAWSTSPIDASLSETGILDRLGVAVTEISARTAVQLTAGGTHVRLTLSNVFGVLPLHVAACTVAIGADDARGIKPVTLRTVTFSLPGNTRVRLARCTVTAQGDCNAVKPVSGWNTHSWCRWNRCCRQSSSRPCCCHTPSRCQRPAGRQTPRWG